MIIAVSPGNKSDKPRGSEAKPLAWNLLQSVTPVNGVNPRDRVLVVLSRREFCEVPLVSVIVVVLCPIRYYHQDFD